MDAAFKRDGGDAQAIQDAYHYFKAEEVRRVRSSLLNEYERDRVAALAALENELNDEELDVRSRRAGLLERGRASARRGFAGLRDEHGRAAPGAPSKFRRRSGPGRGSREDAGRTGAPAAEDGDASRRRRRRRRRRGAAAEAGPTRDARRRNGRRSAATRSLESARGAARTTSKSRWRRRSARPLRHASARARRARGAGRFGSSTWLTRVGPTTRSAISSNARRRRWRPRVNCRPPPPRPTSAPR